MAPRSLDNAAGKPLIAFSYPQKLLSRQIPDLQLILLRHTVYDEGESLSPKLLVLGGVTP